MEGRPPQNNGTLLEPTLTLVERRVRLEHHLLELLELERDYLAKKERLLEKGTRWQTVFFFLLFLRALSVQSSRCWKNAGCRLVASSSEASAKQEKAVQSSRGKRESVPSSQRRRLATSRARLLAASSARGNSFTQAFRM
jgi:hypothetical protein